MVLFPWRSLIYPLPHKVAEKPEQQNCKPTEIYIKIRGQGTPRSPKYKQIGTNHLTATKLVYTRQIREVGCLMDLPRGKSQNCITFSMKTTVGQFKNIS